MTTGLSIYRGLLRAIVCGLEMFPPKRIEREEIELRKGLYRPEQRVPDSGTIWIHGASLGEVITLRPFLRRLNERFGAERLLCTTTTLDGYRRVLSDGLCGHASLLPIDLPEFLNPFFDVMRPRLILISETELWPVWLSTAAERNIPVIIINARINESTIRLAKLLQSLFHDALASIRAVFVQERAYERRYRSLGIAAESIRILGPFKFDLELPGTTAAQLRENYGIPPGRLVIVAGSTHDGEEAMLLDALEPLWAHTHATLVLAPRHMNRVGDVEKLLLERHLDYSRLSAHSRPVGRVLLADTLGELQKLYMAADLAFVGGSLIPRGGHNLMEPAAAGVPFITGSHIENFPSERTALTEGEGMRVVSDVASLRKAFEEFFTDRPAFAAMGQRARQVQRSMSGAADRTLEALSAMGLLPESNPEPQIHPVEIHQRFTHETADE